MGNLLFAFGIAIVQLVVSVLSLTLARKTNLYGILWLSAAFFLMALQRILSMSLIFHAMTSDEDIHTTTLLALAADRIYFPAAITALLLIGVIACLIQGTHFHLSDPCSTKNTSSD